MGSSFKDPRWPGWTKVSSPVSPGTELGDQGGVRGASNAPLEDSGRGPGREEFVEKGCPGVRVLESAEPVGPVGRLIVRVSSDTGPVRWRESVESENGAGSGEHRSRVRMKPVVVRAEKRS